MVPSDVSERQFNSIQIRSNVFYKVFASVCVCHHLFLLGCSTAEKPETKGKDNDSETFLVHCLKAWSKLFNDYLEDFQTLCKILFLCRDGGYGWQHLFFSSCQQILWRDQWQTGFNPSSSLTPIFKSKCINTHCSLFRFSPTYCTSSYKYSLDHQMYINTHLKVVPNKSTIYNN